MRYFYSLIFYFALPFISLFLYWKGRKNPDYAKRQKERYGFYSHLNKPKKKGILIHSASVGEVRLATPLVKALQKHYPDLAITFTTITPTGSRQIQRDFGESVTHCYLPFDVPYAVKRFLRFIEPKVVIIVETELWANLFAELEKQHIPLVIANARLSARSVKRYCQFKGTMANVLQGVSAIFAQDTLSAERYIEIGAKPEQVHVMGNLKFDLRPTAEIGKKITQYRRIIGKRPVWVAGSTHQGEEMIILQAHKKLQETYPDLLLILVPRHLERFDDVAHLIHQEGFTLQKRTDFCLDFSKPCTEDVLFVDVMGELQAVYAIAQVAFVGGSMISRGGHNPLEALLFQCPVISGKHIFNFCDIYQQLEQKKGVWFVEDMAESLTYAVNAFLQNPHLAKTYGQAGASVLAQNQGAMVRLLTQLQPYLDEIDD